MSAPIGKRGSTSFQVPQKSSKKKNNSFDSISHLPKTGLVSIENLLSRKELEAYKNAFKLTLEDLKMGQGHYPIEKQTQILNHLIETGAISLKLNGKLVQDLKKSAFSHFSEETQEAVLHATFFYDAYDQTLFLESMPLDNLHLVLKKPVQIEWKISENDSSFRRIAVAFKASAHSPTNPSSIEIKGTG